MPPFTMDDITANFPGMQPDIQLALSDPLAWEERWEQVFALDNASQPLISPGVSTEESNVRFRAALPHMQDPKQQDTELDAIRLTRKTLCHTQAEIRALVGDDVEQRWMSATLAKRGKIILAGLGWACTATNGRLFLDLLEEMMVQNPTAGSPNMPTYISNPVWDAIVAQQASNATIPAKTALKSHLADRNMLIGFVVHFELCSILDLPALGIYSMKSAFKPRKPTSQDMTSGQDTLRTALEEEMVKTQERIARQIGKELYAQEREQYARGKRECQTCKKINDTTIKYPRCKRCWDTMKREVLYCSPFVASTSECQKVDWKAGHKKECGKWLQLEDLTCSTPEPQAPRVGPPVSGSKRSVGLRFQIAALNRHSLDYEYIITIPNGYAYFAFPHPPIGAAFRACRDKALTTGDRRAVAMLAHFFFSVCTNDPRPQRIGVDLAAMIAQIQDEFQFPEILLAVKEMEQRMSLDAGGRPPLIAEAGVSVAQWQAIPSAWMDVGIVPVGPGS
ncbi:hypothetical protein FB45DRAFT_1058175 [Roridomyces roridus]|uniref:MYND-type domain-containing protein n=1 Tax=Roridomyces roridus TaxID=1738132 RepID=A0AAD7BXS5_9AGAR|nr:hypothetical protein FB45DRAFT_1058175 [Roridomyces roridus]